MCVKIYKETMTSFTDLLIKEVIRKTEIPLQAGFPNWFATKPR